MNRYSGFWAGLVHIGDMEGRVMIEEPGVVNPESQIAYLATIIWYEMDAKKSIQKIYSVEYTLLHEDFFLEILKSLESDIESTVPSEMKVSVASSGRNESKFGQYHTGSGQI